jgi:hypothetical protein
MLGEPPAQTGRAPAAKQNARRWAGALLLSGDPRALN